MDSRYPGNDTENHIYHDTYIQDQYVFAKH